MRAYQSNLWLVSVLLLGLVACSEDVDYQMREEGTSTNPVTQEESGATSPSSSKENLEQNEVSSQAVLPKNTARGIRFENTSLLDGMVDGTVVITKASQQDDITHYLLYWGANKTQKIPGLPVIATLEKKGWLQKISYTFEKPTTIPTHATHLVVITQNEAGEMDSGVGIALNIKETKPSLFLGLFRFATGLGKSPSGGLSDEDLTPILEFVSTTVPEVMDTMISDSEGSLNRTEVCGGSHPYCKVQPGITEYREEFQATKKQKVAVLATFEPVLNITKKHEAPTALETLNVVSPIAINLAVETLPGLTMNIRLTSKNATAQ